MDDRPTLLKVLLHERHWQKFETFRDEYERTAKKMAPALASSAPSKAQYYRWLSGQLKSGIPYPDACRVLEEMFPDWRAEQLFASTVDEAAEHRYRSSIAEQSSTPTGLLLEVPQSFPAQRLAGFWLTCYQFQPEAIPVTPSDNSTHQGLKYHADIVQLTQQTDWRLTGLNFPPEPRTEGHKVPFRNKIEVELRARHLIGHWKNTNDTRYFGCLHLAVLPGETVMDGYYTGLLTDVEVASNRWKWVRLDDTSINPAMLRDLVLREPATLHALVNEHSMYDPAILTADIGEA